MVTPRKQKHEPRSPGQILTGALILAGAIGVGGIVIGTLLSDNEDEVWLEVAKAGVQILFVVLIGGAVAAAWRRSEKDRSDRQQREARKRERDRQVREEQLSVFRQVLGSYHEVKAIRRTLWSLGLDSFTGVLNEVQVSGFREQMRLLNVVQLSFEALQRDLVESEIFGPDTSTLYSELNDIQHYLDRVLRVWEQGGSLIDTGSSGAVVSNGLNDLIYNEPFKDGIVVPRRKITELIHKHLFGPASESTRRRLEEIDSEVDAEEDRKAAAKEDKTQRAAETPGVT